MSGLGTGPTQQPLLQPAMPLGLEARNGLAITGTGCVQSLATLLKRAASGAIGRTLSERKNVSVGLCKRLGANRTGIYPGGCRRSSAARLGATQSQ